MSKMPNSDNEIDQTDQLKSSGTSPVVGDPAGVIEPSELQVASAMPILTARAASAVIQLIKERHLSSEDAASIVDFITHPNKAKVQRFLGSLRALAKNHVSSEAFFHQFLLVFCTNRLINNINTLAIALNMHTYKSDRKSDYIKRTIVPGIISSMFSAPFLTAASKLASSLEHHRNILLDETVDFSNGLSAVAICDILMRISDGWSSQLIYALWQYVSAPADQLLQVAAAELHVLMVVREISEFNTETPSDSPQSGSGYLNYDEYQDEVELRIKEFINCETTNEIASNLVKKVVDSQIIISISYLLNCGLLLDIKESTEKADFLLYILRTSLHPLFEEVNFPVEEREPFVARTMAALFEYQTQSKGTWSERLLAERGPERQSSSGLLPDVAPATWKTDKRAGDTPPDFIKRHYGPWLRADGTGLTRPDVKRLDRSLYTAITNWLQKDGNALPANCPVPTKSEAIDLELARHSDKLSDLSARTWFTKKSRDRAAKQREEQNSRE
jgi:hypothetical protein